MYFGETTLTTSAVVAHFGFCSSAFWTILKEGVHLLALAVLLFIFNTLLLFQPSTFSTIARTLSFHLVNDVILGYNKSQSLLSSRHTQTNVKKEEYKADLKFDWQTTALNFSYSDRLQSYITVSSFDAHCRTTNHNREICSVLLHFFCAVCRPDVISLDIGETIHHFVLH